MSLAQKSLGVEQVVVGVRPADNRMVIRIAREEVVRLHRNQIRWRIPYVFSIVEDDYHVIAAGEQIGQVPYF